MVSIKMPEMAQIGRLFNCVMFRNPAFRPAFLTFAEVA